MFKPNLEDIKKHIQLRKESLSLSDQQAEELEKKIVLDPNDLDSRIQLMSYYQLASLRKVEYRSFYQKHILWMITNRPINIDDTILTLILLTPILDKQFCQQAKDLWLQQIDKFKDNPEIYKNAGMTLMVYDQKTAVNILKEGRALDPADPLWEISLCAAYKIVGDIAQIRTTKIESAQMAYQVLSKSYEDLDDEKKYYQLEKMAKIAFEAGYLDKANEHAQELLKQASIRPRDWNYGNAVYSGNSVLGRIALRNDKVQEAKDYLIKAGETPGSPGLDISGPNMILAKELLEKNEKEAVIKFFTLCSKFWTKGQDRLNLWIANINEGKIPDLEATFIF